MPIWNLSNEDLEELIDALQASISAAELGELEEKAEARRELLGGAMAVRERQGS